MALIRPVPNAIYTFAQIVNDLHLLDSPHLGFSYNGDRTVIQQSHVLDNDTLSVPGMAESQWRYLRTTHEWIPVFMAVDDAAVLQLVDIEQSVDPYADDPERPGWWVTPKGFPREQYYRRQADGTIVTAHNGRPYNEY